MEKTPYKEKWKRSDFIYDENVPIGKGIFAEVFEAIEKNTNKLVVLKRLSLKFLLDHGHI